MTQTIKASVKSLEKSLQAEVLASNHKVLIDEPVASGGDDEGMNPIELLLGGLGACQVLAAKMFAPSVNFQFDEITIDVEGDFNPENMMSDDPNAYRGLTEIRCNYHIKTNESDEKVKEFIDLIEDRCPVSDTLKIEVKVIKNGYTID